MLNHESISDIIIPILTFIGGAIISHFEAIRQYKKKVQIYLEPDKHIFKIYNTGNAGIAIKEVGISQRKNVLFTMPVDKSLTVDADPMQILYNEDDFWISFESSIGGNPIKGKFDCFIISATKKKYKTVATLSLLELWYYHEYYWGRDPHKNEDNDLPF